MPSDEDTPDWEWSPESAEVDAARDLERAVLGDVSARTLPDDVTTAADVRELEAAIGRDDLLQRMAGGTRGQVGARDWDRARKALNEYRSGRRKTVREPWRSKFAAILPTARRAEGLRFRAAQRARADQLSGSRRVRFRGAASWKISNRDRWTPFDIDLYGSHKRDFLQYARSGDIDGAMVVALRAWGGGLDQAVSRIYEIKEMKLDT